MPATFTRGPAELEPGPRLFGAAGRGTALAPGVAPAANGRGLAAAGSPGCRECAPRAGIHPTTDAWGGRRSAGWCVKRLLQSPDDTALTVLRVTVGIVLLGHGAQKLLGWFGGHGVAATIESFQKWFGLPPAITLLVILSDSVGSVCLVLGLLTRVAAAGAALVMLGAIALVHGRWGFYMNWYSQPRGEGFEFHLLVLGILAVLLWRGGGRGSVDRWFERSRAGGEAATPGT